MMLFDEHVERKVLTSRAAIVIQVIGIRGNPDSGTAR